MAAAIVVLPTPPLPMTMIRPCPAAASSSTSRSRPGRCRHRRPAAPAGGGGSGSDSSRAQGREADACRRRASGTSSRGSARQRLPACRQRGDALRLDAPEPAAIGAVAGREHAVDDEMLVDEPERVAARPPCAPPRAARAGRPGHQDDRRPRRIAQGRQRRLETRLLHLQPRMRAEAGGAPVVALEKAGPRLGQAQQAQGVAGRRGVEDDVVELRGVAGQQAGELVEGGDLGGAGARELLAHGGQLLGRCWPRASVPARAGDRLSAAVSGSMFIADRPGTPGTGRGRVGQLDRQHLVEVRRRIGADQQHLACRRRPARWRQRRRPTSCRRRPCR